ncbi:MAG: UMP kinase [Clostridia bacterium]|nr:UMP kinase [Clostridia bacterium]
MSENMKPIYKRVLLKLSGEALAPSEEKRLELAKKGEHPILDYDMLEQVAEVVKKCVEIGTQICIIVGAGNIWRGRQGTNMDRTRADHMGMLATTINALALQDFFEQKGVDTRVMTAVEMKQYAEPYIRNRAVSHLEKGRVVILGGGLGIPFISTDTAAAVRAAEVNADVILMGKNIDGIYTADPRKDPGAVRYKEVSYKEILEKDLKAIDSTAASFGNENHIKTFVFELKEPENIYNAIIGKAEGTTIGAE